MEDDDTEHPDKVKDLPDDAVQLHATIEGEGSDGDDEPNGDDEDEPKEPTEGKPTAELFNKERTQVSQA
jgi:hypothetical protein